MVLSNRGYSLTKVRIWKGPKNSGFTSDPIIWWNWTGFEMTYSSDCCGLSDIVHMYGNQSGVNVFTTPITKKVTTVSFRTYDASTAF